MKHRQIVAINILMFLLLVAPPNPLHAQNDQLGVGGVPQGTPEMEGGDAYGQDTSSRKKKQKDDDSLDPIIENPVPGVRLTLKQVNQLLRTTRDLSGRNLSGLNLVGMNLSRCNLRGADLSRANLERTDFTESNLERVNFSGANLKMAGFFQSAVTAANMDQAVLDGAIWLDKRVCAKGSTGRCVVTSEIQLPMQQPAQFQQPAQTAQPIQQVKSPDPKKPTP